MTRWMGRPPGWLLVICFVIHPIVSYRAWRNGNL